MTLKDLQKRREELRWQWFDEEHSSASKLTCQYLDALTNELEHQRKVSEWLAKQCANLWGKRSSKYVRSWLEEAERVVLESEEASNE